MSFHIIHIYLYIPLIFPIRQTLWMFWCWVAEQVVNTHTALKRTQAHALGTQTVSGGGELGSDFHGNVVEVRTAHVCTSPGKKNTLGHSFIPCTAALDPASPQSPPLASVFNSYLAHLTIIHKHSGLKGATTWISKNKMIKPFWFIKIKDTLKRWHIFYKTTTLPLNDKG